MNHPLRSDFPPLLTLPWLRILRWLAAGGQSLSVAWAVHRLGLELPLTPIGLLIGGTALSNLALHWVPAGRGERPWMLAGIIAADAVLLTGLLHFSGGTHNPFSMFYLVHVALAAVALAPAWVALIALVSTAGYGVLFAMEPAACHEGGVIPMELHLSGMLVAQAVTAACFVAFAGWLQRALRRREAELTQARAEMARQERFASLALLAAGAAHELGTPLNTIAVAAAEVARVAREEAVPAELGEDAELIREEVDRCRGILGRLQQEHVDRAEPVEAGELLDEVSRRLGNESDRVRLDTAPGLPPLRVPREAAVQALLSLTRNALDASPPGKAVQVRATREGAGIRLEVLDEGTGLSPEAAAHAGEPFFSTKPPQQGMGLGLFLVRLLAARVGGALALDARPGGGTRARLDLPAEVA